MRSPHYCATAVRRADQSIQIRSVAVKSILDRMPQLKKPMIRGVVTLIESMILGIRSLSYSGEIAAQDEEGKSSETDTASQASKLAIAGSLAFAFVLGMALFVALPHGLAALITSPGLLNISVNSPFFHLLDGMFKIAILLIYVSLIGRIPDVNRVFQYHGAEHQSIYTFEAGKDLLVREAKQFTPLHPRCGTSFLLFLVLISIGMFSILLPALGLTRISEVPLLNHIGMVLAKIILMFPVAGLSYEFIKACSLRMNSPFFKMLIWPGLKLQLLTTRAPSDDQLEVALASLRQVLRLEKGEAIPGEIRIRSLLELNPVHASVVEYPEL